MRATLAAIPAVGGTLQVIYEDVRTRYVYRTARTVNQVAELTGVDHLEARLRDNPEVEALFVEAVEAASRTGLEAKRRLLAQTVGTRGTRRRPRRRGGAAGASAARP